MDAQDPRARRFRRSVESLDATAIRSAFDDHPELAEVIDQPWFSFASPALVHAAGSGPRDVLDALFDLGADPTAKSDWDAGGYTALHKVVDAQAPIDEEQARYLIGQGVPVDLHSAAGLGDLAFLEHALDAAPERVSEPGPDGATPLHLAKDIEVAQFLLDRGADIDKRCVDHKSTAAQWAVAGREEITRFLIERGARPDLFMAAVLDDDALAARILAEEPEAADLRLKPGSIPEHLGGADKYIWALDFADTPLEVARRRGHDGVYQFLLEKCGPPTRLLEACRRGDAAAVDALVAEEPGLLASLDADAVCDCLCAPPEAIRALVQHGADPDAVDADNGATAMHNAAWKGEIGRIAALLDAGADPNIRDSSYLSTPVGWANENGQSTAVDYLVANTDLDLVDAAWLGKTARVAELLDQDPGSVNGPDGGAMCPLRGAAHMGHVDVVRVLLERGAERDIPNPGTGMTALQVAESQGHDEVAALLRDTEG